MAFADDFVSCMSGAGITIEPGAVPEQQTLQGVLDYVKQQVDALSAEDKEALDAATTDAGDASVYLAESDVGLVDSTYVDLLKAFDAAVGFPLSTLLEWCVYCLQQAAASAPAT